MDKEVVGMWSVFSSSSLVVRSRDSFVASCLVVQTVQQYPALAVLESGSVKVVATPPLDVSEEKLQQEIQDDDTFFSAIILGASGDLAHKKT